MGRDLRQRSQDDPGVDTLQGVNQYRDRKNDDEETRSDP